MTDLRTPYATRLCLSGVESRRLLETFRDFGVKHLQVSYYYLRKVFSDPAEFAEFAKPFSTVIIDSGTVYHRFKTAEEKESFLGEYAAYIGGLNKRAYTAAVSEGGIELDSILDEEAIIYPLDDIRPVFDNDMDALFRNVKYVGVSQKEATNKGGQDIAPLFSYASKHNAWIHLFGTSTKRILNKYPIYSANTSSWRSGSRYLNTYIYEGPSRGLKLIQPSDKKDTVKTERELKLIRRKQETMISVRQAGVYEKIDWRALYEGDPWEVDKGNLAQWVLYQGDLENKAQNKYFLSEDDKRHIAERQKELLSKKADEALSRKGRDRDGTPSIEGGNIDANIEGENNSPMDNYSEANNVGDIRDILKPDSDNIPADTDDGYIIPTPHNKGDSNSGGSPEETIIEGEAIEENNGIETNIDGADISTIDTSVDLPANSPPDNNVGSTPAYTSDKSHDLVPKRERLRPPDKRLEVLRKCDDCILAGRCAKYTPGADCAYGYPPAYHPSQLEEHVLEDAGELLAMQKDRIMQAYLEEKVDAAGLSKELGKELERYFTVVQLLAEAQDKRDEINIKAKGAGLLDIFKKG